MQMERCKCSCCTITDLSIEPRGSKFLLHCDLCDTRPMNKLTQNLMELFADMNRIKNDKRKLLRSYRRQYKEDIEPVEVQHPCSLGCGRMVTSPAVRCEVCAEITYGDF